MAKVDIPPIMPMPVLADQELVNAAYHHRQQLRVEPGLLPETMGLTAQRAGYTPLLGMTPWVHENSLDAQTYSAAASSVDASVRRKIFQRFTRQIARRYSNVKFMIDEANGLPINPSGRTGIAGLGDLKHFGPNHAADSVIVAENKAGKWHLLMIRRGDADSLAPDCGPWALPGGMVDAKDYAGARASDSPTKRYRHAVVKCAARELGEETRLGLSEVPKNLKQVIVYQGQVGDHRDTDHAWMETSAVLTLIAHDLEGIARDADGLPLIHAGDDAKVARWISIMPQEQQNDGSEHPRQTTLHVSDDSARWAAHQILHAVTTNIRVHDEIRRDQAVIYRGHEKILMAAFQQILGSHTGDAGARAGNIDKQQGHFSQIKRSSIPTAAKLRNPMARAANAWVAGRGRATLRVLLSGRDEILIVNSNYLGTVRCSPAHAADSRGPRLLKV